MPIYDYKCTECGKREEKRHQINTKDVFSCGECNGSMRIDICGNKPLVKFKGYGWPSQDFKKSDKFKR